MALPLESPTVLVTGTSSGIGLATAIAVAGAGYTTVATVRDPSRADALRTAARDAGVTLDIRSLDVTDGTSVVDAVQGVIDSYGRLDALINNAGAATVGTVEQQELAEIRAALEVNFFGVVAMTKAALPHLRASGGRLITVSSVGGIVGQPFNEAYCAAKFAVEGFMESLAPVAESVGVRVSLVEPGAVASSFVANAGLDTEAMIASAGPYAPALTAYLKRTQTQFGNAAQGPGEVAETILGLLAAENPALRTQTSAAANAFVAVKLHDLDGGAVRELTGGWLV